MPSGEQTAAQIFSSIGVELHWSCDTRATNPILIRLAARVPKHFRKGTLAFALPFARKGVRITVFYDRLEPIFEEHLLSREASWGMFWRTRSRTFWKKWMRTPKRDLCADSGAKTISYP